MLFSSTAPSRKLALLGAAVAFTIILFYFSTSFTTPLIPAVGLEPGAKPGLVDTGKDAPKGSIENDELELVEGGQYAAPESISGSAFAQQSSISSTKSAKPTVHSTSSGTQPSRTPYEDMLSQVQDLRQSWNPPPIREHWPPYDWYANQDYDPNRWEGFEWQNDYYVNNGVKKLSEQKMSPKAYLPYPDYNSREWKSQWKGEYAACKGARGKRVIDSEDDIVRAWPQLPKAFPDAAVGDAQVLGLDTKHCFDRYNRYGPYGYGDNAKRKVAGWKRPYDSPDWDFVNWGKLQDDCLESNADRYRQNARGPMELAPGKHLAEHAFDMPPAPAPKREFLQYHQRTAILIRSWQEYNYTENDKQAIRAMITETSLLSGGEFQVYLFVNIAPWSHFWTNPGEHQELLDKYVPQEFHSIAVLWNEKVLREWYPLVGDWQVYWHQFMPLQWFSKMHPEFDFVWNWETDARYTGNHYHFLSKVADFGKSMPRKYLWERNSRFYIPAHHGTYTEFLADTDATVDVATRDGSLNPVWGPQPFNKTVQQPIGPRPPQNMSADRFEWGVGEDADLITLQPIWDPTYTWWSFRDKIFNYIPGLRPQFTQEDPLDENFHPPEYQHIPRRTYINTLSRFSRRQLDAMHLENVAGRSMQAEMWPASVALQHGLKAVYAPHPIWADRKWPAWYMDFVFNADGGDPAQWSSRGDSVYNQDREHNFAGFSWYYASSFPRILYRRWLGWKATVGSKEQFPNNPLRDLGGRKFEEKGVKVKIPPPVLDGSQAAPPGANSFIENEITVGGHARMCLPGMLLHPVKNVYASAQEDAEEDGGYEGTVKGWLSDVFGGGG